MTSIFDALAPKISEGSYSETRRRLETIRTALRTRLHVEADVDHWTWRGQRKNGSTPVVYVAKEGRRRAVSIRRFLFELLNGPAASRVREACGREGCVNPEHVAACFIGMNRARRGAEAMGVTLSMV